MVRMRRFSCVASFDVRTAARRVDVRRADAEPREALVAVAADVRRLDDGVVFLRDEALRRLVT
jgi:hypothetical protein